GLELFGGYAYLKESQTRRMEATFEAPGPVVANDYRDSTALSAPAAAFSASYQFFENTPLLLRVWLGTARARVSTTNSGTFSGSPSDFVTQQVLIPEKPTDLWIPFAGPEVRF